MSSDETFVTRTGPFKNYKRHKELVEIVTQAQSASRCLDIEYRSFARRETTLRRVAPYRLCYFRTGLYVIGKPTGNDWLRSGCLHALQLDRSKRVVEGEEISDVHAGGRRTRNARRNPQSLRESRQAKRGLPARDGRHRGRRARHRPVDAQEGLRGPSADRYRARRHVRTKTGADVGRNVPTRNSSHA
ncbi:MAG: WYL domain-containing protein [Acidobacteria bacterium]|nr:MAG: WYL domain-containing protein [Acidobacteriota bacterium]